MKYEYFKHHLQQFWDAFQNAKIVEKSFQRAKHLIIVTLTFQISYSKDVFLVKVINNAKLAWKNQN